ncbi:MAG: hypothetical protein VCA74_03430, partial [Deltaproteobacteria bacterium]
MTIVVFALVAAAFSGRELVASYHASRDGAARIEGLERAARISPSNWRYPLELASIKQAMGLHAEAGLLYRQAISRFGGCGLCWVGLAETEAALGRDPGDALAKARRFGRAQTNVRTRAAVIFARRGQLDEAAGEFRAALGGYRWGEKRELFALLHRVFAAEFVLARIVPTQDLKAYFHFTRTHLGPADVAWAWQAYRRSGGGDARGVAGPPVRHAYVDYLLAHGMVHEAWRVGLESLAPPIGTVLNGGFEDTSDHGRLGWRIGEMEGVRTQVVACPDCPQGGRALRLRFDGEHNVHYFRVVQYVPVIPGAAYR